jgi:RNA polymerase sigma-70 factor (family 1)
LKHNHHSSINELTPVVPMGKEKTFDCFFRQYYAALCFFAQSIIHNEEDAKDIVQDCFIKLWDDAAITEKAASVKSFLYTMVRNRCIDYVRKKKVITKAATQLQTNEEDLEYFDELAFAEMVRQVLDHIEELPANMSTILKKYYLLGKRHKEIANELSITPDAVRMQKIRAIKLLKQKLLFSIYHLCGLLAIITFVLLVY